MASTMAASSSAQDVVDGRKGGRLFERIKHFSGDSNKGSDSAYNSGTEEGNHIEDNMGKKKLRKSKQKHGSVEALVRSIQSMNIHLLEKDDSNLVPYDINDRQWSSSESSLSSVSDHSQNVEPFTEYATNAAPQDIGIPWIFEQNVKIQADNCKKGEHGECLLKMGKKVEILSQKTKYPVFSVEFGGCFDDKNTTLKWMNKGKDEFENLQFGMLEPSSSEEMPEEPPAPIDEDSPPPLEEEEPSAPNEEDQPEEEMLRRDQVDASMEENSDGPFTYRLATVKDASMPGKLRVVAVHIDDTELLDATIQWKLAKYGGFFTLRDPKERPEEHPDSECDLHLAVSCCKPEPFFVRKGKYWNFFVNPEVKLSIWPSDTQADDCDYGDEC
ncbi:uncharacterized protein [Amphiura filiformis]|uniref:uncharacterized protein n=1 Tax=Amphiura filiformis TaxID=82378 RepID=UPI003B210BD8